MSTDLTFITNESGQTLRNRFEDLLHGHTRFFDCLVAYFYVSGFFRIFRSLERTEKVRILIGLSTDRTTFNLLQQSGQGELYLASHAEAREQLPSAILRELEKADDTAELEEGVRKFIEWDIRHCKTYTEDDEEFIRQVVRLLEEGSLPRPTTRKVAEAIKPEIEPLRVLAHLRRNIPAEFLRSGHIRQDSDPRKPREVILSSWVVDKKEQIHQN